MPKKKSRPPIVKTDYAIIRKGPVEIENLFAIADSMKHANIHHTEASKDGEKFHIYQRTWRKVQ